jgi:class 3 adenylate cyclase
VCGHDDHDAPVRRGQHLLDLDTPFPPSRVHIIEVLANTGVAAVRARLELCHQGEELDLRVAELECPLDVAVGDRVRKRSDQADAFIPHPSGEYRLCCPAGLRHARRADGTPPATDAPCDHAGVPRLSTKERSKLPNSAFAYIDSRGRRRLPIHDASHVRNALARFSQVAFEDEEARDRARSRLLRAAQKQGIMPIGFINAQLQPQRKLPTGHVTFLVTDIEGSTELLRGLGDQYGPLLADVRRRVRDAVRHSGGREASARGDDVFAVFALAPRALDAALAIQRAMHAGGWPHEIDVRLRIGLHRGRPALTDSGYVGLSVHAAARICFAAHGGQIIMSSAVREAVHESLPDGVSLRSLGSWRFRGLPEPVHLFQTEAADLRGDFPPLRSAVPAKA